MTKTIEIEIDQRITEVPPLPKVSIVLPSYNGSTYIKKSIESVIAQDYTDWELLIVDDCSTDETLQIARAYAEKDARIKVHHNETNQKLPESLNIGFRQATGEYFTWTSDDNWYMENAIGTMVGYLDKNSETGLCYADYRYVDAQDQITGEHESLAPNQIPFCNVVGACFMYRRNVAEAVGEYDKTLFLAEDYDYWLRISSKTKLSHIPEILYCYRQHDKSLSQTRHMSVCDATSRAWENSWDYLVKEAKKQKSLPAFLEHYYEFAADKKRAEEKIKSIGLLTAIRMARYLKESKQENSRTEE